MRISKKAEYGLRALVAMARRPQSWSIHELSEHERIPVKFLEQILLALRHSGVKKITTTLTNKYRINSKQILDSCINNPLLGDLRPSEMLKNYKTNSKSPNQI